jgi:hypothetical protein
MQKNINYVGHCTKRAKVIKMKLYKTLFNIKAILVNSFE